MSGDGSIEYRYQQNSHYSIHHRNYYGISDDETLWVSVGDLRHGYGSLDTSYYSSRNSGVYHSGDQSDDGGRGGYRSQDTIPSSSCNRGTIIDAYGRGIYMSCTNQYFSHKPGGCGILSGISFYSRPIDKNFHGYEIVGSSGHGNDSGNVSGGYSDERGGISGDYGGEMVYWSDDGGRGVFMSQNTSHSSSCNHGSRVDVYGRGGYRSHTSHSSYHKPGDFVKLLCLSVASFHVHKTVHGDEIGDISGDDGRREFISRDTIHYYFHNIGEIVYSDGRGRYRSHTKSSPPHNTCGIVRLLGFSVHGNERSVHRY